jgi:predicted dehydrogenase
MTARRAGAPPNGVRLGIIGTGWIGLTRARTAAADGRVTELHLADVNRERVLAAAAETNAASLRCDYTELLDADVVDAVIVSTAPEDTHYPIARDCLAAGKHVLLEKPMARTLGEADALLEVAEAAGATLTVGYTQRFQPKLAFVKEQFDRGALGQPTTILISRHLTRELGAKIASRGRQAQEVPSPQRCCQ